MDGDGDTAFNIPCRVEGSEVITVDILCRIHQDVNAFQATVTRMLLSAPTRPLLQQFETSAVTLWDEGHLHGAASLKATWRCSNKGMVTH